MLHNLDSVPIFQFYNDYGDIIKYTLNKCREISKVNTAQALAVALSKVTSLSPLPDWPILALYLVTDDESLPKYLCCQFLFTLLDMLFDEK